MPTKQPDGSTIAPQHPATVPALPPPNQKGDPGADGTSQRELDACESQATFATSSTTAVDIPAMVLNPVCTSKPQELKLSAFVASPGTVNKTVAFNVMEGSTLIAQWVTGGPLAGYAENRTLTRRVQLSPGAHSLKLQAFVSGGANGGWFGSASNPAQLSISER